MTWWAWMILGAVIFGAELFAIDAQFFLVFIGLSAALVGVLELIGVSMPEWAQWLTFAAIALISMFTFRKIVYKKIYGNVPGFREGVAGQYLVVSADLESGGQTRASFHGSDWTVINDGGSNIASGARVKILRNESLTLYVSNDPE